MSEAQRELMDEAAQWRRRFEAEQAARLEANIQPAHEIATAGTHTQFAGLDMDGQRLSVRVGC